MMPENHTPNIASAEGISHTPSTVNWDYWSRLPTWRADEAASLLSGIDPDVQTTKALESLKLKRWLIRASKAGELRSPLTPASVCEWADEKGISVPDGLRNSVKLNPKRSTWKQLYEAEKREKKSLLIKLRFRKNSFREPDLEDFDEANPKSKLVVFKLLCAMATKYGYARNGSTAYQDKIMEDLYKIGVKLGADSMKFWLDKAHDAVSEHKHKFYNNK